MNDTRTVFSDYHIRYCPYTRRITVYNSVFHSHTFWEISYVLSGMFYNQCNGKEFPMVFTDVVILRPKDTHKYRFETSEFDYRDLYVPDELMKLVCDLISPSLYSALINAEYPITFKLDAVHISSIEKSASYFENFRTRNAEADDAYKRLVYRILSLYMDIEQNRFTNCSVPDNIANLLRSIERNPIEFNPDSVIKKMGYSRSHVNRLFLKYAGMPLRDFILQAKLVYASDLILNNDYKLVDIAYLLGFGSQSSFIKAFKKFHGCLPSEYRNNKSKEKLF